MTSKSSPRSPPSRSFVAGAFAGLREWRPDGDAPDGVSPYHWRSGFILGTVLQVAVVCAAFLVGVVSF